MLLSFAPISTVHASNLKKPALYGIGLKVRANMILLGSIETSGANKKRGKK